MAAHSRRRVGELELHDLPQIVAEGADILGELIYTEYLTSLFSSLSGVEIWLLIAAGFAALGIAVLFASYYPSAETSFLWTERYRKIRGTDHTGIWLEVVFTVLLALNMLGLATAAYPDAAKQMLAGDSLTWKTLTLLALLAICVLWHNFSSWHQSALTDEISECRPDIVVKLRQQTAADLGKPVENVTDAEFDQRWREETARFKGIYNIYALYSILSWWMLLIGFLLFGVGAWGQYGTLSVATQELVSIDIVNRDGAPVQDFGASEQLKCQQLVREFFNFREVLLGAVNKFLLSIALFSLLFSWLLGTRFQDIYAPFTRDVYRCIACFFLLFLLPGIVIYGYVHFVRTTDSVIEQFHRVDDQLGTDMELADVSAFNEFRQRMVDEASISGFATRVASSWGSVLMLLQFVASRIGATRVRENLFPKSPLMEAVKLRVKLFFTDPKDDHPVNAPSEQAKEGD